MRKWILFSVFCFATQIISVNAFCANPAVVGFALDFPAGALDSVKEIELILTNKPKLIVFGNNYGYTNMDCNRNDPNDFCPGYKDIPNYLQYLDPTYDGPAIPGALGLDWQRVDWEDRDDDTGKIRYTGGEDTIQRGILDGYAYEGGPPGVVNINLDDGYSRKTKWSLIDTGITVTKQILINVTFDVYALVLEDEWYLEDAILVAQIMAGMDPLIPADGPFDVNADGDIGLAEAVYMLQKIAGVRSLAEGF